MADEVSSRDVNFVPVISGVTNNSAKDIVQIRVDETTSRLLTDANTTEVGHTAVGSGIVNIGNTGAIQQLSNVSCKKVFIQASESNLNVMVVGGSSVAATLSLRQGLVIYPTQGVWFNVSNLNLLYVASNCDNGTIHYFYES